MLMAKTVITYGIFDMFHIGHLKLLRRQKALGNKLIIAVPTDVFNERKNKKVLIPYEQRAEIIAIIQYVSTIKLKKSLTSFSSLAKQNTLDVFKVFEQLKYNLT